MFRPLIAIALAATVVTAPAFAGSDDIQLAIDFSPDQLVTAEKAAAEYDRIRSDAHKYCAAVNPSTGTNLTNLKISRCEKHIMETVVASIDNDNFTAAHNNAK